MLALIAWEEASRSRSGVAGVVLFLLLIILILVLLLLRVLLLRAPWRTIIRSPLVIGGAVILGGLVARQVVLAGRLAAWKLDGVV